MAELCLGIARARLGPSAALVDSEKGIAACEENRLSRARQAATSGPPELAIQELLAFLGRSESDIRGTSVVKDEDSQEWWRRQGSGVGDQVSGTTWIDPHVAHAEYALRSSGFEDALVVVCDASAPDGYSAFKNSKALSGVGHFPIARIYGELTEALGFASTRDEYLVEAMARAGDARHSNAADAIQLTRDGISTRENFRLAIEEACSGADSESARRNVAAAVQQKLGVLLVELLERLEKSSGTKRACLSGGLFFNTHFTTIASHCGVTDDTFFPSHPGRNGSALGAALLASGTRGAAQCGSPYLGPSYSDPQVKEALENCKLSYDLQREEQVMDTVLRAISRGQLVGWFHGRLEWGPRALGHRTVLADPFAPHVLDNLNGHLKKRPGYRSYGVSMPLGRLDEFFELPAAMKELHGKGGTGSPKASPFMQYEYQPRDLDKFRAFLPEGVQTLRVQTVDESEPRYLRLLERWGEMSGTPVLVNTSFNGFHEPLVCSPRDAIRVFYGTGLDLLALEDFILRK